MTRIYYNFLVIILILLLVTPWESSYAQTSQVRGANTLNAYFRGKTKPLSELAPKPATPRAKREQEKTNKPKFMPPNFINFKRPEKVNTNALPRGEDPVRQRLTSRDLLNTVTPNLIIEGIDEDASDGGVPDTNGDVGPDHYVQMVNASWFQVFSKDGTALTAPTSANTIWNEIGMSSFSDPLILFDEAAGRWLITDLASISTVLYGVSETADPMGSWNLYSLTAPSLADYPKYGIWPNAYVLTINAGGGVSPVYAINREQMLAGASTIDIQRIEIPGLSGGFPVVTPMDWNSPVLPPTDEVFVVRMNDDAWGNGNDSDLIEVWSILVDWDDPDNTISTKQELPTVPFDSDGCSISVGGDQNFECIPQPGTTQGIDGIMAVVMHNVAYWNYGTHESAALAFSVDAGNDVSGIRWMELRREPGEDWFIYQEGTYAPDDGGHRFIPGIAINGNGDIGLAYSVSGEEIFPSLRYTGRREEDPLGEMTVDEFEFGTGTGVRTTDRYGDYAKMSVDPLDGSFWFTSEYVKADGSYGTKIVNFVLRKDTFDIAPVALITPVDDVQLTDNETVTVQVKNLGLEPATEIILGYIFESMPPVAEPATIDTLFPDSIYEHTFIPTVDMAAIGDYNFKIFATFPQDQNSFNDTLRRVRRNLPRYDVGISNIKGLEGIICAESITVNLIVTNYGQEDITSLKIDYQLNNGAVSTIDWTGNLASGETEAVEVTLTSVQNGSNTLLARTSMPNGEADEIPDNDEYSRPFQSILGGVDVTLQLNFDPYPPETSWQLEDENGNIIYTGGPYTNIEPFGSTTENWCLELEGCYTFTIFDTYGDGMSSMFGNGSYNITFEESTLASITNANFGFEESNDFCISDPCSLEATYSITPESSFGSGDGTILVTVTSGVPPFSFSIDGGETFQSESLFTGVSNGTYQIIILDANNCGSEEEIIVGMMVGTSDSKDTYSLDVYPNPSANGAFKLTVEGLQEGKPLEVQILDATGRPISYQNLAGIDGKYEGIISIKRFPPGMYIVRFLHPEINRLLKIIRL
ncbi:MAG: hypothetical protein DHS20C18_40350 [Saprospiraceae bacterium]|nr:MAG: hypothetical protein DHS20C18_40350 [Saprospiraceae bacterium]